MTTEDSGLQEASAALHKIPLDIIRCEALAVAGFTKEATAISETRVAIDELSRAYDLLDIRNYTSSHRMDTAIHRLIGKLPSVPDVPTALDAGGVSIKDGKDDIVIRDAIKRHYGLSEDQAALINQWAADDRLWTMQETVEFNLQTLARALLTTAPSPAAVTGEWTVKQIKPTWSGPGALYALMIGEQRKFISSRKEEIEQVISEHQSALAQLTARAEAAEAKLKALKERI